MREAARQTATGGGGGGSYWGVSGAGGAGTSSLTVNDATSSSINAYATGVGGASGYGGANGVAGAAGGNGHATLNLRGPRDVTGTATAAVQADMASTAA